MIGEIFTITIPLLFVNDASFIKSLMVILLVAPSGAFDSAGFVEVTELPAVDAGGAPVGRSSAASNGWQSIKKVVAIVSFIRARTDGLQQLSSPAFATVTRTTW